MRLSPGLHSDTRWLIACGWRLPRNRLNRDSLPRPSSLGTGRTRNHRESTTAPAGLARGSAPSSLLQGHPPSLRFGHPDVATEATETSTHPPEVAYRCAHREPLGAATFSGSALRVSHGRSPQRSKEEAERPGDGCPCVGAEETCSAHRSLGRREVPTHPTPVGTRANTVFQASNTRARGNIYTPALKTVFQGERKNPADSEESAGFSLKCAPWDSNPEPID